MLMGYKRPEYLAKIGRIQAAEWTIDIDVYKRQVSAWHIRENRWSVSQVKEVFR